MFINEKLIAYWMKLNKTKTKKQSIWNCFYGTKNPEHNSGFFWNGILD